MKVFLALVFTVALIAVITAIVLVLLVLLAYVASMIWTLLVSALSLPVAQGAVIVFAALLIAFGKPVYNFVRDFLAGEEPLM